MLSIFNHIYIFMQKLFLKKKLIKDTEKYITFIFLELLEYCSKFFQILF